MKYMGELFIISMIPAIALITYLSWNDINTLRIQMVWYAGISLLSIYTLLKIGDRVGR